MTSEELKLLIAEGEGLTLEFKEKYTPKIDRDIVALANAKGGYIILGVSDDCQIVGEKITNSMKAEILTLARNCDPHINILHISQEGSAVVIEIPEGEEKPYSCSSGYFRRLDAVTQKMTQKEVRAIFRNTAEVSFESLPCKDFFLENISLSKVNTFLKEAKASLKVNKDNLPSFLSSLGLYKGGKINNAGALMFAADIKDVIPYCETILGAYKGKNKTYIYDRKDVRDDLFTQFNEAIAFLKKHLNVRSEIRELDRHDIYEIPLDVLREALVNALIHRDYGMRGTNISVNVFDDRVEIVNPGGLPAGINKENFGKESVRRNLIIADLFHRMSKVERVGSGIGRMRNLMKDAHLHEPVFESDTFFRAIFYRSEEYALKQAASGGQKRWSEKVVRKGGQKITTKQESVLNLIKDDPTLSRKEISEKLGINESAVQKHLEALRIKGFIKRVGPDKGGHWEVIDGS